MKKPLKVIAIVVAAVVAIVVLLNILFWGQTYQMSGDSMSPTLVAGQKLFISKDTDNIQRGDIVVFKYPKDHSKRFVKRVVGLPNETISLKDGELHIITAGGIEIEINEPYAKDSNDIDPETMKENEYYILGDNRTRSSDSRHYGPIDSSLIIGVVIKQE
jgi:signal peptidase I